MTPVPELFREAVAALQSVRPRREVLLEPMRAPQRLAPWSYAVSCEVSGPADVLASGRLVLLHDPLVDNLFYASATPITKDLFFSAHTATVLVLGLTVQHPALRRGLLLAGALIGLLVMVQHAHYTYDVLAAPLFAGLSAWLARRVARY